MKNPNLIKYGVTSFPIVAFVVMITYNWLLNKKIVSKKSWKTYSKIINKLKIKIQVDGGLSFTKDQHVN